MSNVDTIEELKREWRKAKKAADSLGLDFASIEAARDREGHARRRYTQLRDLEQSDQPESLEQRDPMIRESGPNDRLNSDDR